MDEWVSGIIIGTYWSSTNYSKNFIWKKSDIVFSNEIEANVVDKSNTILLYFFTDHVV
jgi:hypothetical protein